MLVAITQCHIACWLVHLLALKDRFNTMLLLTCLHVDLHSVKDCCAKCAHDQLDPFSGWVSEKDFTYTCYTFLRAKQPVLAFACSCTPYTCMRAGSQSCERYCQVCVQ